MTFYWTIISLTAGSFPTNTILTVRGQTCSNNRLGLFLSQLGVCFSKARCICFGVFGISTNSWARCAFGNVYPLGLKHTRFAATFQWLKSRVKNNPSKALKVATKALSSPPSCAPGRLMSWQQVDIESVRIHHTTRPSADQPHASTWDSRWDGTFRSAFSLVHLFCMVCHRFGFCCCGRILLVFNCFFLSF